MRIRNLLGAALALALVPGAAAADESKAKTCQADCNAVSAQSGSGQQQIGSLDENGNCICTPQGSVGGTGSSELGTGSSQQGQGSAGAQGGVGAGGVGAEGDVGAGGNVGGSGAWGGPTGTTEQGEATGALPPSSNQNVTVVNQPDESAAKEEKKGQMGLMVKAGGGVEGYTSSLAPKISPGPAWGVSVAAMPTKIIGLELNYAGATNGVKDPAVGDADTRITRNGGSVDVRVNLLPTGLSPFIFGGVGINRASVSNETAGYKDDTFGNIPLGAGLDWRVGNFVAGARMTFNYLFDRNFTPATQTGAFGFGDKQGGDSYNGQIQLGGVF